MQKEYVKFINIKDLIIAIDDIRTIQKQYTRSRFLNGIEIRDEKSPALIINANQIVEFDNIKDMESEFNYIIKNICI